MLANGNENNGDGNNELWWGNDAGLFNLASGVALRSTVAELDRPDLESPPSPP